MMLLFCNLSDIYHQTLAFCSHHFPSLITTAVMSSVDPACCARSTSRRARSSADSPLDLLHTSTTSWVSRPPPPPRSSLANSPSLARMSHWSSAAPQTSSKLQDILWPCTPSHLGCLPSWLTDQDIAIMFYACRSRPWLPLHPCLQKAGCL